MDKKEMGYVGLRVRQIGILVKKNVNLMWAQKRSTIIQCFVPVVAVFVLFLLQFTSRQAEFTKVVRETPVENVGPIPACTIGVDLQSCLALAYVAPDAATQAIVQSMIRTSNLNPEDVKGFPTALDMNIYMLDAPNTTQGAIVFQPSAESPFNYTVQFNKTTERDCYGNEFNKVKDVAIPIQYAADRAIAEYVAAELGAGTPFTLKISTKEFPHPELSSESVIGTFGPTFFFSALMFNFVIQMGQIVSEKELKLREAMSIAGMKSISYWISWFITNTILNLSSAIVLVITGLIFQLDFFLSNAFGLYFFLFTLFAISMVSFTLCMSVFVNHQKSATTFGFCMFLIGIISFIAVFLFFDEDGNAPARFIFSRLPFVLLAKGITDIAAETGADGAPGMAWADRSTNAWYSLNDVFVSLVLNTFLYFFLALYLDEVVPGMYGTKRYPWFCLTPSYWTGKKKAVAVDNDDKEYFVAPDADVSVDKEARKIVEGRGEYGIEIRDLFKTYTSRTCGCCRPRSFTAVKGLTFGVETGSLFCLLGHNGAGKTTTIGMMTGLFSSSFGDATVLGNSITTDMEEVRDMMGVCPQHDILWDDLTGEQHLRLFAALKGFTGPDLQEEVDERLKDVDLTAVRTRPSKSYSGGMRRRLSVAMALIGDPKVVYLDEPTTGMDPISRRKVWKLIENKKGGDRMIILTTHSMEEADVLGDQIAIMSAGQLKVIGDSLYLKKQYGTGYRVTIVVKDEAKLDDVRSFVDDYFEQEDDVDGPELVDTLEGTVTFDFGRDLIPLLPAFLAKLEGEAPLGVQDVQLNMASLEEVFLNVAKEEHTESE